MKKEMNDIVQRALTGFAAGVMVAASIWSLLIPAIEQSEGMGKFAFVPAVIGFWLGVLFLLMLDHVIPHLHRNSQEAEGPKSKLQRTTMLVLAVTLHNIPEGMAVGVVFAGYLTGKHRLQAAGAMALAIGIAIQNFPEGAIISMPLRSEGMNKGKAFLGGMLSRHCGTDRCSPYNTCSQSYCTGTSLFPQLCSGSYALCCSRRADSGDVRRRTFRYWNHIFCSRFLRYDGIGCCVGIKNMDR